MSGTVVRLSASSFVSDASQMGAAARRIQSVTGTAAGQLSSCAGMAGIDPMAEEFALGAKQEGGYDQSMQSMLDAGVTLSQAVAGFEGYLLGLAAGYRAMELGGVSNGSNQYVSLTPTQVVGSCAYTGSSLGDEQRGTPQGEIMEWLENFLKDTAGIVIPTADTAKVRRAASAWENYSSGLSTAKATVAAGLPGTSASTFPQQAAVLAVQSKLEQLIDDLSDDARSLGAGCTSYADNVDAIRGELLAMLGQLALEIAIDIGVGIALSFFTFGAGAAAGLAKAATTVARWVPKLIAVVQKLKTLIMSAKRTMAVMRRASIEMVRSTVSGTVANAGASLAFGNFSWDQLGGAALSSGIGGGFAGPFSHIGGNIASRGSRITVRASVDGVTGAAGGIAGEWAASQVTGQDFNLLMAALVGTVGGAAGGGLTSIKNPTISAPSSAGVSTPPTGSGGGSSAPAASAGSSGPGSPASASSSTPTTPGSGGNSGSTPAGSGDGSAAAPAGTGGASGGSGGAPSGGASGGSSGAPSGGAPAGGGAGGAPASGGAAIPDGQVDVPASLGGDGPASGTPAPGSAPSAGAADSSGRPETDGPDAGPGADAPSEAGRSEDPGDPGTSNGDVDQPHPDSVDDSGEGSSGPAPQDGDGPGTDGPGADVPNDGGGAPPHQDDPPGGDPAWAHHPASLAPIRPELDQLLNGSSSSGPGWHRAADLPVEPTDPRARPGLLSGDRAPHVDVNGHATQLGDAARLLGADPTSPYGHRPDGSRYADGAEWSMDHVEAVHGQTYGNMKWAPNEGAVPGTRVRFTDLGTFQEVAGNLHIDRLGDAGSGTYMGIGGGTFGERALPPGQMEQGQFWHVDLSPTAKLPEGWSFEVSRVATAYGQPGGGLQLVVRDGDGQGVSLQRLEQAGIFSLTPHEF